MTYMVVLTLAGGVILLEAIFRRVVHRWPVSLPMVFVALGMVVFALPLGLEPPDPIADGEQAELLAELAVIIALMGAGLKIDRVLGWRPWRSTWGLLAITLPLTIVAVAVLGWVAAGLMPSAALLLAGALAPTDPVLASDVQTGPPREPEEDEVRFALTSEAGLNDGLAFPFVNAAIAAAGMTTLGWVGEWLVSDVLYKLAVGLIAGLVLGRLVAWIVFSLPGPLRLAEEAEGLVAVAATLVVYGATQLVDGYGFLAVFVAAVVLRRYEHGHDYPRELHDVAESFERLLVLLLLLLLGGAVVGGLLTHLSAGGVLVAVALVLVIRPITGLLGLAGAPGSWGEKAAVSFFGIRGIGSIYYLAHGLGEAGQPQPQLLWAIVGLTILISVVLHGATAGVIMRRLDLGRQSRSTRAQPG
ncbi:cation:proton antiporter [soil metagenome]